MRRDDSSAKSNHCWSKLASRTFHMMFAVFWTWPAGLSISLAAPFNIFFTASASRYLQSTRILTPRITASSANIRWHRRAASRFLLDATMGCCLSSPSLDAHSAPAQSSASKAAMNLSIVITATVLPVFKFASADVLKLSGCFAMTKTVDAFRRSSHVLKVSHTLPQAPSPSKRGTTSV